MHAWHWFPRSLPCCRRGSEHGTGLFAIADTLLLLEVRFAVMISSMPSAFTSPKVTERGLVPVAKVS